MRNAKYILVLLCLVFPCMLSGQVWDWVQPVTSNNLELVGGMDVSEPNQLMVMGGAFSAPLNALPGAPTPKNNGSVEPLIFTSDLLGNFRRAAAFPASNTSEIMDVAFDSDANIYTGGYFSDSLFIPVGGLSFDTLTENQVGDAPWLVKLDSNLQYQWHILPEFNLSAEISKVIVSDTLVIVGGLFQDSLVVPGVPPLYGVGFDDVFIMAIGQQSGQALWLEGFYSAEALVLNGLAADANQVYFTGNFPGLFAGFLIPTLNTGLSVGGDDIFLAAMDKSSGFPVWVEQVGGLDDDSAGEIDVRNGNLYLVGHLGLSTFFGNGITASALNDEDAFIARYNASTGLCTWARSFNGRINGNSFDSFEDVEIGNDGYIYVAGQAEDSLHLGPGIGLGSPGNGLHVVTRFDPQGNYGGWYNYAFNADQLLPVSVHKGTEHIYTSGVYENDALNFLGSPMSQAPAAGGENIFLARLGCRETFISQVVLSDSLICAGDSVSVSVYNTENSFVYFIQDSTTGAFLAGPTPGNSGILNLETDPLPSTTQLYVTYYNANASCLDSFAQALPVTVSPTPEPDLGPDTLLCGGDSLVLDAGGGFSSYIWNTLALTSSISVDSAGLYFVKVQSADGCSGFDSVVVQVGNFPEAELDSLVQICDGQSPIIALNACPNCATYLWSNGDSTATTTANQPGWLFLTTASLDGCAELDSVRVEAIAFAGALPEDTVLCEGDSILLTSSLPGQNFLWSTGDTGPSLLLSIADTIVLEFDQGTCSGADTIVVVEENVPLVELGEDSSLCEGDTIVLVAGTAGSSYTWQDGSNDSILVATQSDTYILTVGNAAGCEGRDSIQLIFQPAPNVFFAGLDSAYCVSDPPVSFIAAPGGGQFIGGTLTGNVLNPSQLGGGNYTIEYRVVDSIGCSGTAETAVEIFDAPSDPVVGEDQTLNAGTELEVSANAPLIGTGTWSISPTGPQFLDANSATTLVSGLAPGEYTLTWTTRNGTCPAKSAEFLLLVNPLSIPDGFSPNGDMVNDNFVIRGIESFATRELAIFNRWGNEVFRSASYNNEWDGANLADDTYYYSLNLGDQGEYAGFVIIKR